MLIEQPTKSAAARTPMRVWIGLAIAVVLDVPVQLIWKALMLKYGDAERGPKGLGGHSVAWFFQTHHVANLSEIVRHQVRWFSHQTRSWFLLALFGLQFLDWIWVLGNADLSFAQPFTALSYVAVSTFAVLYFHEHMTVYRVLGITAILFGVILIGSSEHRTAPLELTVEPEPK